MINKEITGHRFSTLFIILTWLVCFTFAGAGALLAPSFVGNDSPNTRNNIGTGIEKIIELIVVDVAIIILAITVATLLSYKLGYSISRNKSTTKSQITCLLVGTLGILIGLATWAASSRSPAPSIFVPIMVTTLVQIASFIVGSMFVFGNSDPQRKRVWSIAIYFLVLTTPSIILYYYAK
jgi:hypothetical protein